MELISIITSSYNSSLFIEETINSIIAQTYQNWELLITDDCSTDNTINIIAQYAIQDNRIKVFQLDKNSGTATARNNSIKVAKGNFIAFCDSDDIWYSTKLERQINLIKEKDIALCFTAIEMIDENGILLKEKRYIKEEIDYAFLLRNTIIATSSLMIDRNKTGNFNMPIFRIGEDYATWLMLMRNGTRAYGINEALVKYRIRQSSLSSSKLKNIKKVYKIQTQYENINIFSALINCCFYAFNALKKYFF